jgi:hypothetical protein
MPQCSAHGLRKAAATSAAEKGATEAQLKAIFGWKTSSEVDRHIKAARQRTLAGGAQHLVVPEQSVDGKGPTSEPVQLRWDKSSKKP